MKLLFDENVTPRRVAGLSDFSAAPHTTNRAMSRALVRRASSPCVDDFHGKSGRVRLRNPGQSPATGDPARGDCGRKRIKDVITAGLESPELKESRPKEVVCFGERSTKDFEPLAKAFPLLLGMAHGITGDAPEADLRMRLPKTWPDLGTGLEKGVNFADLRGYGPTLFGQSLPECDLIPFARLLLAVCVHGSSRRDGEDAGFAPGSKYSAGL